MSIRLWFTEAARATAVTSMLCFLFPTSVNVTISLMDPRMVDVSSAWDVVVRVNLWDVSMCFKVTPRQVRMFMFTPKWELQGSI